MEVAETRDVAGFMAVLQMVFADLTGSDTVTPKVDISDMAPEAPRGWYATPYKTADGEEITKARFSRSPIAKKVDQYAFAAV